MQSDAYHDFFVITNSVDQEHFRTSFDWLPDHEAIVLTVRETAHGLKVLYDSGHLLEYAVFDLDEIAIAKANDYHVAFDRSGRPPICTYSGDVKRRLNLVWGLMTEPEVLFLDESTQGLDSRYHAKIWDSTRDLRAREGSYSTLDHALK